MALQYTKPKGTQDFIGRELAAWNYVENEIKNLCAEYRIMEIRTPMFESTDLFIRGVGETTDIVNKEMYSFVDNGGRRLTLRPEGTVNAARAYIENGLASEPQPVKWFYISPAFRAENTQKGRYRQFTQFGVEYFGTESPYADAEVISIFYRLLNKLGIDNVSLRINSLGGDKCRSRYNETLKKYIGGNIGSLCAACRERYDKNPLRVLDCKSEQCREIVKNAPPPVECLDSECKAHFDAVCGSLTAMGIAFTVDPLIVRGLDYYTKTVFEFVSPDLGAQSTVCGGGRYDNLVSDCGGAKTGAVGFGVGLERLIMILTERGLLPEGLMENAGRVNIYVGSMGLEGALKAQEITYMLRSKGIAAECDISGRGVKAQIKYADKIGAEFVAMIGDNEIETGVVKLKNMKTGEETETAISGLADLLDK